MTSNYPGNLDNLTNPGPLQVIDSALQVNQNDSIEAIQGYVGVTGSVVPGTVTKRIVDLEGETPTVAQGQAFVPASATSGTAINAAIAAFPATGGTILLGGGTHTLDVAVVMDKSSIILRGMGQAATLVQFNPSLVPVGIAAGATTRTGHVLENFLIFTTSGQQGNGTAIDASAFNNSKIRNVGVGSSTRYPNIGILYDSSTTSCYYNTLTDSYVGAGGASGIAVKYAGAANENQVSNVRTFGWSVGSTGIQVGGNSHTILLSHVDSESQTVIGVDILAGSHDVTIIQPYWESIDIGLRVASGCEGINVLGGWAHTFATAAIVDNGAVSLNIDNMGGVAFNPYSSRALTGVVVNKINGTNVPSGEGLPDDFGLIAWNYDILAAYNNSLLVNGTLYLQQINVRFPTTITNLSVAVTVVAVTPVAGQSFMGLYDNTGARVALTADIGTATTSTGHKSIALTAPYVAAAGKYWVAILVNAATPPQIARAAGLTASPFNFNLTAANLRFAANGTALTALPASVTPASNTAVGALTNYVACS